MRHECLILYDNLMFIRFVGYSNDVHLAGEVFQSYIFFTETVLLTIFNNVIFGMNNRRFVKLKI